MSQHATHASKTIQIQYYALLREERGLPEETLTTNADTPRALYEHLKAQHGFSLSPERLRVAINNVFADWDQPLSTNDSVVFIPPVAGG